MVKGSCLCGGVHYQIDGEIGPMAHCYCSMCRKQHGAAFGTYVGVKAADFRWVKGEELVASYQSSPGGQRGFCRTCGSNLPVLEPGAEEFFIPAGTLDDDPGVRPAVHIFVASKAPWVEIDDELPQFDEYPPGFGPEAES
jgi:hypothetical protein